MISALPCDTSDSRDSSIFLPFGETIFPCFYLYVNYLVLNKFMRTGFLPLPLPLLQVITAEQCEKHYRVCGVLFSGRGVGLFRSVFYISTKVARTIYGPLKALIHFVSLLVSTSRAANTGSIVSLV